MAEQSRPDQQNSQDHPEMNFSDPEQFAEPDPIAQERVMLERVLLDTKVDKSGKEYKDAVRRIHELNDQFKAEPGSLRSMTNPELLKVLQDHSTPIDTREEIQSILELRHEGEQLPPKRKR